MKLAAPTSWQSGIDTEAIQGPRILVASADDELAKGAELELGRRGFAVLLARDDQQASRQLYSVRIVDAVVVDMGSFQDVSFLQAIREAPSKPEIVALAEECSLMAELAAHAGADVCHWPPSWSLIEERLRRALSTRSLKKQLERATPVRKVGLNNCGPGEEHMHLVSQHHRAARTSVPLLIVGPAGSPRVSVAHQLHELSGRAQRSFVEVAGDYSDDDALHEVLFGNNEQSSAFEHASGGSLFIDEIDKLSVRSQAALARTLETSAIVRNGREYAVDTRLICGTTVDLRSVIEAGAFRPDLLYRLGGITLRLSPLKQREQEIIPLCERLLAGLERGRAGRLSRKARDHLEAYHWPGNEAELELVLRRAVLIAEGDTIEVEHLGIALSIAQNEKAPEEAIVTLEAYEERAMRAALNRTQGNVTQAARLLAIGRATFYRKAKKFGIAIA